jgi:hypothetical protein
MPGTRVINHHPFIAATLGYTALAAVITFPLVFHLSSAVPGDLGDPLLSTAILWWNAHVMPLTERWWNGFAFAPATGTLAFSDHRLGLSLLASPLQWLGASPLTSYNIVLLLTFPLCALGAHALGFTLTKRHDAAAICGLAYGFNPFRIAHLSHLELLAGFAMPAALAALHVYLRDRRARWMAAFALALFVQGLCSTYYLLFFAILVTLWLLWFVRPREWRDGAVIGLSGACAAAALSPIALAYWRIHRYYGFSRMLNEIQSFSADLSSLVTASPTLRFWGWTTHFNPTPELQTFPGLTIAALAAIGLFAALRRTHADVRRHEALAAGLLLVSCLFAALALSFEVVGPWKIRAAGVLIQLTDAYKPISIALLLLAAALALAVPAVRAAWSTRSPLAFYLCATVFLVLCSFGPSPSFLGQQFLYKPPYEWIRALPVIGDGIRVPARFTMPAALALAVAGALAFDRLKLTASRRLAVAAIAMAGIVADGWIAQVNLYDPPQLWPVPAAYRFGPVLELPFDSGLSDFLAMYRGTLHGHPVVNGASGFFPPHHRAMRFAFDDQDAMVFDAFTQPDPLLVAIDKGEDRNGVWESIVKKVPRAQLVGRDARWTMYGIPPVPREDCHGANLAIASVADARGPVAVARLQDNDFDTSWRTSGPQRPGDTLVIDLGRPARVCAIRMSVGDIWQVYPRGLEVAASVDASRWTVPLYNGSTSGLLIRGALDDPRHIWITVPVHTDEDARFFRLRLNVSTDSMPWLVAELRVVGP